MRGRSPIGYKREQEKERLPPFFVPPGPAQRSEGKGGKEGKAVALGHFKSGAPTPHSFSETRVAPPGLPLVRIKNMRGAPPLSYTYLHRRATPSGEH